MKSEGVRRLSLLAGGLGLLPGFLFGFVAWANGDGIVLPSGIVLLGFFAPWGAVQLIAWVVQGFMEDRRKRTGGDSRVD